MILNLEKLEELIADAIYCEYVFPTHEQGKVLAKACAEFIRQHGQPQKVLLENGTTLEFKSSGGLSPLQSNECDYIFIDAPGDEA